MSALASGPLRADVFYREQGYYAPLDVLSEAEAARYRHELEKNEARFGQRFQEKFRHKPHLLAGWAWELIHHPTILDAVESVIGPDILCWESSLFTKAAASASFVSWHQDLTYWGLDADRVVTAWLALSPSTPESGCMRVIPASHLGQAVAHRDTFGQDNLLSRGQEVAVAVDESEAVDLVLRPGQASLHHVKIVHGSEPNRSADRRIGLAIRYLPPDLKQTFGAGDSATLVRGHDRHLNFEHEQEPEEDFSPRVIARHERLRQRRYAILMRNA